MFEIFGGATSLEMFREVYFPNGIANDKMQRVSSLKVENNCYNCLK